MPTLQKSNNRATASEFTYDKMKLAIGKVSVSQNIFTTTNSLSSEPQFHSRVEFEKSYYRHGHDKEDEKTGLQQPFLF